MVGRMSVSSTHGPGRCWSTTSIWPLFGPAEVTAPEPQTPEVAPEVEVAEVADAPAAQAPA